MKQLTLLTTLLFTFNFSHSQSVSFNSDMDVMTYMEGKTFYNTGNGLEIEYGYVSAYGTYGIEVTNKNGGKFYYIDVKISTYGGFADLYGMDPDNGNNFGFRLYKGKLIVGRGEAGETTFFLR